MWRLDPLFWDFMGDLIDQRYALRASAFYAFFGHHLCFLWLKTTTYSLCKISPYKLLIHFRIFHRCNQETTVRGYTIPKDTYIMPHLDAVLLSEKIWGDPHRFRPERFIDSQGNLLIPAEFIPFSLGT